MHQRKTLELDSDLEVEDARSSEPLPLLVCIVAIVGTSLVTYAFLFEGVRHVARHFGHG